jgi:hypothetical protein
MSDRGDLIDRANDKAQAGIDAAEAEIRYQAQRMPAGKPGECEMCGEWSGRLVRGICSPFRDKYRLP